MPEIKDILVVLAFFLLAAQNISILNKGKKDWKELSGAAARETEMLEMKNRIGALETEMTEMKSRLEEGEKNFRKISSDTAQIMNVLDGLLMHFISGNDREKLRSVKGELDKYKNERMKEEN